ncbi:unnamed protein product, partial [marine sediment metagenome]
TDEKIIRHVLTYEFLFKEELYHKTSKAFGHLRQVAEWDVVEIAVFIKAAFQDYSMEVGIPS